MRSAIPAQERLTQNALTVGVNCVNRTRKHAASVTAYSVLRACPSIQCSTRSLHRQATGNVGNEKGLEKRLNKTRFGLFGIAEFAEDCIQRLSAVTEHRPVVHFPLTS